MVVLDTTIVNVALPHIQEGLGLSGGELSWVLNAYLLTFGGLLLLGARSGDLLGRRRTFLAGIAIFSVSSLFGGFAVAGWMLLSARALQGVGAALAAPSSLALLTTVFSGRAPAGPGHRPLHDRVGGRGSDRPGRRRRADPARVVALGDVRQRADRDRRAARRAHRPAGDASVAAATSTSPAPSRRRSAWRASCSGWSRRAPTAGRARSPSARLGRGGLPARRRSSASRPGPRSRSCRCGSSPAGRARAANVSRGLMYAGMYGMFFFVGQFLQDVQGYSPLRTGLCFLPVPGVGVPVVTAREQGPGQPGPAQGADDDAASASPSSPCSCRASCTPGRRTRRSSSASSCSAWARGPRSCP